MFGPSKTSGILRVTLEHVDALAKRAAPWSGLYFLLPRGKLEAFTAFVCELCDLSLASAGLLGDPT